MAQPQADVPQVDVEKPTEQIDLTQANVKTKIERFELSSHEGTPKQASRRRRTTSAGADPKHRTTMDAEDSQGESEAATGDKATASSAKVEAIKKNCCDNWCPWARWDYFKQNLT